MMTMTTMMRALSTPSQQQQQQQKNNTNRVSVGVDDRRRRQHPLPSARRRRRRRRERTPTALMMNTFGAAFPREEEEDANVTLAFRTLTLEGRLRRHKAPQNCAWKKSQIDHHRWDRKAPPPPRGGGGGGGAVLMGNSTTTTTDDDDDSAKPESVVIVGAGPTGLVTAVMLARRGWTNIRVLEKRNRPEKASNVEIWGDPQRSYNIGLSARGQLALQKYDLLDVAREYAKEVKGRCDFDKDGKPVEKLAQKKFDTQVLQRDRLVAAFLEEVERNYSDVITVEHGVAVNSCTFSESGDKATLQIFDCKEDGDYCDTDAKETIETSLVIGAEGNAGKRGSAVIRAMDESKMCKTKMVKLKERIESTRVYKIIPIELPAGYRTDLNYSSRTGKGVAMECLPTKEGLLVGVLLIKPTDEETCLKVSDPKKLREYLDSDFPMFSKMVSDENVEKIAKSKFSGLPNFQYAGGALHLGSCAGLIGDAIHTVKPYFGMGVNSAFEDITVLEECIEKAKGDSRIFLPQYSKNRAADAKALVKISHSFDGGFLTFVLPLILDSVFNRLAPWLFMPNTIQMLQKDDWSFVRTSRRKRFDRTLQITILATLFGGSVRLAIMLVKFLLSKRFFLA